MRPRWLEQAVPVIRTLVARVVEHGLTRHSILNVNLPDRPLAEIAGIRAARLGGASCHDRVCLDGDGSAAPGQAPPRASTSCRAKRRRWASGSTPTSSCWPSGFVTITPMRYDLLDAAMLAQLSLWDLDLDGIRTAGA